MLDIVFNFFIIRLEDEDKFDQPITEMSITVQSYLNNGFWFDFLVWVPWGLLLSAIFHEYWNIFEFVKCFRLIYIGDYLNNANLKSICQKMFDYRFQSILDDPILRVDFRNNRTMIESRILVNNSVIALKILCYTILALYLTGTLWLCFSLIFFSINNYQDPENYFIETQLSLTFKEKLLQSFYFTLTTLSTVGFGDFYPKSDFERIVGGFIILFGVALFSIIINEFLEMID